MAEIIQNKNLSGPEIAKIIEYDVNKMLNTDPMLSARVAYGKIAYKVTIQLQMANPTYPSHEMRVKSQDNRKVQEVGSIPLKDGIGEGAVKVEEVVQSGKQRNRVIDNPNLERVKHKLPVITEKVNQKGVVEKVSRVYTPEQAGVSQEDADPDKGTKDSEMEIDLK